MKRAAIVILNWNGKTLLEQFLPSVIRYSNMPDTSIIVADNGSSDDSVQFLRQYYPQVELIELGDNYGFADGYNRALQLVEAEYFILLNSDVEVTEDWLAPLLQYLDDNKDVAALQPKIKSWHKKDHFEYAGAAGGFIDKYGYPFCRGRIFNVLEQDYRQYDSIKQITWASGACLVIRSADFVAAGGFDATFFAHMEEIDLCWRLNARGRKVVCYPFTTVYHVGGATLNEESPRKTYLNFRNNLLMLFKNTSNEQFNTILRIRKKLDKLAWLKFIMSGKKENAKAITKAYKDFSNIKEDYTIAREKNLAQTVTNSETILYPKSILFEFYIKGNKRFSQLK